LKAQVKANQIKRKKFNERDTNSLLNACSKGDLGKVKRLLSEGVDPDAHGKTYGFRPLHSAASHNHIPIARALLEAGADINARGGYGGTDRALEEAAAAGHLAMVRFLIAQGAEINRGGVCPALTKAAEKGKLQIIDLLLKNGASFETAVLNTPMWDGNVKVVEHLVKAGAKVVGNGDKQDREIVSRAVRQSRSAELTKLIAEHGADLLSPSLGEGSTPLHRAWHEDTALFLIEKGADVHAVSASGNTPLHSCASRGFTQACKRLLDLGADPRARNRDGDTPRTLAKRYDKKETYQLLNEAFRTQNSSRINQRNNPPAKQKPEKQTTTLRHQFRIKQPTWKISPRCASGFMELAEEGYPEFAVFAVKAPFTEVSAKGQNLWPKAGWQHKVGITAPEKADAGFSTVGLIEIRDNPWTMVLVSMWTNDVTNMVNWAAQFSKALRTTAVAFCNGDGGYQLTVHWLGELHECINWCGGEVEHFKSTFRKQPKLPKKDEQIADLLIGEHGIYFAPCYPCELDTKRLGLAVAPEAEDLVVRADLLEPGRLR
jgi:ankyrin repeat protein